MRVLFLTQTGPFGPSSRYRVYQLLPKLQQQGIECDVSPAISDARYESIYLRHGNIGGRLGALIETWRRRRMDLTSAGAFDAVIVQKGVFHGLYAGFERKIASRKPLVFDFDDAVWLPRQGGSPVLRMLHREGTVQNILRCAATVITGNEFLATYARRWNSNVTVIPSAIDLAKYPVAANLIRGGPHLPTETSREKVSRLQVGWIGSSTTLAYLNPLKPVFSALGLKPRVIASGDPSILNFEVEFRPWQLKSELDELSQIGIGISPLPDTPWERGKCGVKLLQYMACGIPVVASPVGVHNEMIRHGENGFLANTTEEWIESLRLLQNDPSLRQRLGVAGRKLVEEKYSVQKIAPQLAAVLKSVVRN